LPISLVDHSVFRAFNKGALAEIQVIGDENTSVFSGKQKDLVYLPEGSAIQSISAEVEEEEIPERTLSERMTMGENLFELNCGACHQANGEGIPNVFPPLAKSDYLMARKDKGIGIVLHGLTGPI